MAAEHDHERITPTDGAQPGAGAHAGRPDQPIGTDTAHAEHEHASVKTYLLIGLILTVLTAAEVAVFYVEALAGVLAPLLITMSIGKFVLVVMFYMHLKFDNRVFTSVFVLPLMLAISVVIALILLFRVLPTYVA